MDVRTQRLFGAFTLRHLFAGTGGVCLLLALIVNRHTWYNGLAFLLAGGLIAVEAILGLMQNRGRLMYFCAGALVPAAVAYQTAIEELCFQRIHFYADDTYTHVIRLVFISYARRKIILLWGLAALAGIWSVCLNIGIHEACRLHRS